MIIAEEAKIFYRSDNPSKVFGACPNLCVLPSGRMIVSMCVFGPGIAESDCEKCVVGNVHAVEMIYLSDDNGETWRHVENAPMEHGRVFTAGKSVYLLGHEFDLLILRSDDGGETWTKPVKLTEGQKWCHEAPCNVLYDNGKVYLVMERQLDLTCRGTPSSVYAPVLMRADCSDDLTRKESWTFATEMCCRDTVDFSKSNYFGIPFYPAIRNDRTVLAQNPRRSFPYPGWSESNVVKISDPNHFWFDPNGKTFHLIMSAHTGRSNIAAVLKVTENEDGSMTTDFEKAPSGEEMLYLPFPGGAMKFYILWDEVTRLYWMAGMQAFDSMTRPEFLNPDRMGLPCNETNRLVLHFSKNCVDWCFAGVIDEGKTEKCSRYSPSMAICGDDLIVLARSADEKANCAHDSNIITIHKIPNFRTLRY